MSCSDCALVTLTGWASMLFVLIRMFAPLSGAELGLDVRRPEESVGAIYAMLVVLFAMGPVLIFKAYSRGDRQSL